MSWSFKKRWINRGRFRSWIHYTLLQAAIFLLRYVEAKILSLLAKFVKSSSFLFGRERFKGDSISCYLKTFSVLAFNKAPIFVAFSSLHKQKLALLSYRWNNIKYSWEQGTYYTAFWAVIELFDDSNKFDDKQQTQLEVDFQRFFEKYLFYGNFTILFRSCFSIRNAHPSAFGAVVLYIRLEDLSIEEK